MGAVLGFVTVLVAGFAVDVVLWCSTPCEGLCQEGATSMVFTFVCFIGLFVGPALGVVLATRVTRRGKEVPSPSRQIRHQSTPRPTDPHRTVTPTQRRQPPAATSAQGASAN